jgi:hypothetical protein
LESELLSRVVAAQAWETASQFKGGHCGANWRTLRAASKSSTSHKLFLLISTMVVGYIIFVVRVAHRISKNNVFIVWLVELCEGHRILKKIVAMKFFALQVSRTPRQTFRLSLYTTLPSKEPPPFNLGIISFHSIFLFPFFVSFRFPPSLSSSFRPGQLTVQADSLLPPPSR